MAADTHLSRCNVHAGNLAAMLRAQIECSNLNKIPMVDLPGNQEVLRKYANGLRRDYSSMSPVDGVAALGNEVTLQNPSFLGSPSHKNAHYGSSMV